MTYPQLPYQPDRRSPEESLEASRQFYEEMNLRRSVRFFDDAEVPREVIDNLILTAGTAPSGAHKQPWTFCAVRSRELQAKIREAAEEEEARNYSGRMNKEWLEDLAPLGTDENKPFLEVAPWLIVVFKHVYEDRNGQRRQNYYVNESVGIACGFLLAAIHKAGLASLTHTPSPMNFLQRLLGRPENERAYLLIPVGYPARDATVPDLKRKPLDSISTYHVDSK